MTTAIRARFGRVQVVYAGGLPCCVPTLLRGFAVPIGGCGPYYPYYGYYGPFGRNLLTAAIGAEALGHRGFRPWRFPSLNFSFLQRTQQQGGSRPWMGNHPRFAFFLADKIRESASRHRAKNIFL